MIAVIETGGKQYCIRPGQKITVERINTPANQTVTLTNLLTNEAVTLTVIDHVRSDKIVSRKFRNKTRYHRLKGHRQPQTVLVYEATKQSPLTTKRKSAKRSPESDASQG